jgi:TIR domain
MWVAKHVASIFISYRREDAAGHAGRLCDRLTARFGNDRVFMDIQDIHPGQNFATSIEDTIATCDCVIAVIGPHWLESVKKREQSHDDFVRHEIGAGLQRHLTVIPVLVGGARMPAAADLPADLTELSFLNAIEIRDERFDRDVLELENFLASQRRVGGARAAGAHKYGTRHVMFAAVVLVVAAATAAYVMPRRSRSASRGTVAANRPAAAAPSIAGEWIAEMQNAQQHRYRIRLRFEQVGNRIRGLVRYPTGDGPIQDGELSGNTLTFSTSHVPQFESSPVTTRFLAEVTGDGIRLTATYDGGMATGVATRATPRPPQN